MKPLQQGSVASFPRALVLAVIAGMIGLNLIGPSMTGTIMTVPTGIGQAAEPAPAPNPDDITPPWGTFPKAGAGIDLAGELLAVDHINRRLCLRLDGDFDRYRDCKLRVTLLPYAEVWYHGAPADLFDIPLGTRLHGRFLLPPKDTPPRELTTDNEKRFPPPLHDRGLVIEDGFSHERRRGRAFRIDKLEIKREEYGHGDQKFVWPNGSIAFTQVQASGQPLDGPSDALKDAIYSVDASTRVWKDGRLGSLEDLAVGQIVQVNLGWTPDWATCRVHCLDIWTDEKSCAVTAEQQRQIHLRRMRHYWVPGWIDKVEYEPDGNGLLTVTYFAGMDKQVYDEINCRAAFRFLKRSDDRLRIIGGGEGDNGSGVHVRKWHDVDPSPPPGSSGITHEIHVPKTAIQEAFRPGRFLRSSSHTWPRAIQPPEWRIPFPAPLEEQGLLD